MKTFKEFLNEASEVDKLFSSLKSELYNVSLFDAKQKETTYDNITSGEAKNLINKHIKKKLGLSKVDTQKNSVPANSWKISWDNDGYPTKVATIGYAD